jgi:FAD binding domain/Berberine and berberine like
MDAGSSMTTTIDDLHSALRPQFQGDLLRPTDAGYASAHTIWNGMVARKPGLIARCANELDVQTAVRAAASTGIITAIRCGGHSLAGFGTCDGGMVIDLSLMRQVSVDAQARRARFAGGCLLGTVDAATQEVGLAFPAGVVSHTGVAGLVLGGGTGWLTRMHGLSCDNVEGFKMVCADGSLVRANHKENTDLFWALRGGGGNFGVVTEFEVKLHPLKSVIFGSALCRSDDIHRVLRHWREFMPQAPDQLKWGFDFRLAPHDEAVPAELRGKPVASESVIWIGDGEAGHASVDHALSIGNPVAITKAEIPFGTLQTMADDAFPHGNRYYTKSGYFTRLDESVVDLMLSALLTIPSPMSLIELTYLGGAMARVGPGDTAFGDRSAPFIVNILGNWKDPADDLANVSWVRKLFADLRPSMKPGVYVNFMSGDEDDRVPEAYRERWDRLVAIKTQYDPANLFRLNQNIRPHKSSS